MNRSRKSAAAIAIGTMFLSSCVTHKTRILSACTNNFRAEGAWSYLEVPPVSAPSMRKAAMRGADGEFVEPLRNERWFGSTNGDTVLCQAYECGLEVTYFAAGSLEPDNQRSFIEVCADRGN